MMIMTMMLKVKVKVNDISSLSRADSQSNIGFPNALMEFISFSPVSQHDISQHFVMHFNAMQYIWLMYLA